MTARGIFLAVLLLATPLIAQEKSQVDETEILRRGNMVQEVGVIEYSYLDVIGDALAPPEDDSDKWFISILTTRGCRACDTLKVMFRDDQYLKAWVQDTNVSKAYAHLNVWDWADATQKYRWERIKDQYPKFPESFPCLIIQPPKNGKYGENKNVVALVYWDGKENGKSLSTRMRNAVASYIIKLANRDGIKSVAEKGRGIQQSAAPGKPVGAPWDPPFDVPAKNNPQNPYAIPPNADSGTSAPLEAFIQACPGAPLEWVLKTKSMGVSPQVASVLWQQENKPAEPTDVKPVQPPSSVSPTTTGVLGLLSGLLGGGLLSGLVVGGLMTWRSYRTSTGQPTLLSDDQFSRLVEGIRAALANRV